LITDYPIDSDVRKQNMANPLDVLKAVDCDLDFFLRKFQFQSQWIREAVGEVGKARQHVDIDDLGIGEMLLEFVEVRFRDFVRSAG
jgi:isocitrate/isopropylmalate dehydrogenase